MDFLAGLVAAARPDSILDVGCADGRFLDFLVERDPSLKARYAGVDLVPGAIELARVLNRHDRFYCADVGTLTERFAAACLIEVIEHVPDEAVPAFLGAVRARIIDGGRLYVSVPSTNVPLNVKHYRHYDPALLEQTLAGAGFRLRAIHPVYRAARSVEMVRRLVENRLYSLHSSVLTRAVWRLHLRLGYHATVADCSHLVAEADRV
jgi:cyclopropane fatty-acyl-phospholipid synthase-like methyltransferase